MAIKRYAGDRFIGLAIDTKPTNVVDGAIFDELDTGKKFQFYSTSWSEIDYASNTDVTSLNIFSDIANSVGTVQFSAANTSDQLRFEGTGATSVSFDAGTNTITFTSTDNNTTYSAGDGLTLTGTTFAAEYASTAEAEAGINAIKLMTPATTEDAILNKNYISTVNVDGTTITGNGVGTALSAEVAVSEITDVVLTSLSDEDILFYDSGTGNWVNGALSDITPAVSSLNDLSDVTLTTVSSGDFLRYDGAEWVNTTIGSGDVSLSFDDLTDVILTTPVTDQLVRYDGSDWINFTLSLNYNSDVTLTTPTDNDFLRYDGSNWVNESVFIPTTLDDLTGVDVNAPSNNEFLVHDGTSWKNVTASLNNLNDVTVSTPTSGQFLIYDGAEWANSDLPALAITDVYSVADITARDALTVQEGDIAIVTDANPDYDGTASYVYDGTAWQRLETPDVAAAGSDTHVQFNNSGDFGADPDFRYVSTTSRLRLEGQMTFVENTGITPSNPSADAATMFVQTRVDGADTITEFMAKTGAGDVIIASYVQ